VRFSAGGALAQAIDEHAGYIWGETLTVDSATDMNAERFVEDIDGHRFGFSVEKIA